MATITPEGVLRCDDETCPCQTETVRSIGNTHDPDGHPEPKPPVAVTRARRAAATRAAKKAAATTE
jgi:hypothetical protein